MAIRLMSKTYWRGTWIRFREPVDDFANVEVVTLNAHDGTQVRGLYWTPKRNPKPKVVVVAAHPRVDFSQHYTFPDLLRAGYGCLGANTRSVNNDSNCVHEQQLLDLAAYVRWLKEDRAAERLVWLGNSGGGSLGGFYQQQAKAGPGQRLKRTPAGRPLGLNDAVMPPFDAMMITAAHTGQGLIMNNVIDPSVVDEDNPLLTVQALDMYDPANGFRPAPEWTEYDPAFIERYHAAQLARVARIDGRARALLAAESDADAARNDPGFSMLPHALQRRILQLAAFQPLMLVYRTMANLNYVDRRLDPSNRGYGSLLSERPDLMNLQLQGFGRVQTPDAWLSTWSGLSSNANLLKTAAAITEPVVVLQAGRDRDCYPQTHAKAILDALSSPDKTFMEFPNRLHYFEPDEGENPLAPVREQMDRLVPWLASRLPL
jgi:alpha-beta hydrolase superfamily lysophospholipase